MVIPGDFAAISKKDIEATLQQQQLVRELETARRQNREQQEELGRARAELMDAQTREVRAKTKPGGDGPAARKPLSSHDRPATRKPLSVAIETERWFISYPDDEGNVRKRASTAKGILLGFAEGLLRNPADVLASRSKTGPFKPLTSHPEFAALLQAAPEEDEWTDGWSDDERSDTAVATKKKRASRHALLGGKPEAAAQREPVSMPAILITIVIALITAVLAVQFGLLK